MTARFETLVIAPHADDEVLGCSSVLTRDAFVLYVGIDDMHVVDRDTRLREVAAVSEYFGFSWSAASFCVNRYYTEHFAIIQEIERVIEHTRPTRVFIPSPSYNQDHRTVSQACHVALRQHDRNHFVPRVFGYEAPDSYVGYGGDGLLSAVNYFIPVDIERKLRGYRLHASQVRAHRSEHILRGMAAHRGAQSMLPGAEGFHVVRWVEQPAAGEVRVVGR
ncbi:MAG TPA: hypothetical protein VGT40_10780 [Methylomirabilota bacterium]|jgi:LmbE family N-acetylglucosaminyl deacetylase|nr:hypothetical protein [Methylomirabilota bacterium]